MNQLSRIRTAGRIALALGLLFVLVPIAPASAVEFPDPASNLYFQTSGPSAGLGIGDFYTSTSGDGTDHVVQLPVPADWPAGTPVTVAVYDPESRGGGTALGTNDEIRGAADTTRFRLVGPGGTTIADQTFPSSAAYHGRWVELATFVPAPGTVYLLRTETALDDDNSWRLSFNSDPDCAVNGTVDDCSGIEDGDESDDPDGVAGTGDELAMGFVRASYQFNGSGCADYWFYADGTDDLTLHNFDMDGNTSVTYIRPNGSTVAGTVSGGTRWNNTTGTVRVGDTVAVAAGDIGWWRARLCAGGNNQFVFEVEGQVPLYFAQPPTPLLTVSVDDADADIAEGEPHVYEVTVTNASNAGTAPGAAIGTSVTVPLPAGVVYEGCTAPAGVTCSEAGGVVTFSFADPIVAGQSVDLTVSATGGPGMPGTVDVTATARYEDQLGNSARPVSATDSDVTRYPDLSVTVTPDTTAAPGDIVSFAVAVANLGDHVAPGTSVVVPIPGGATVAAGTDPRWSCSDAAPLECVWTVGTMTPGAADTAALAFELPDSAPAGWESFPVDAAISGTYTEVVSSNNAGAAVVTVSALPDLAVTVVAPAEYIPGHDAGWSLLVENVGDQDAAGVVATVIVPADADATPAAGWTCVPDPSAGSTCTFPVGDLAAGGSVVLPFPVATDPAAVDPAALEAEVADDGSGGSDADLLNNEDEDEIAPDPQADLTLDVAVTTDPVNVGDPVGFVVTVGNDGPSVATDVLVVVTAPAGMTGATLPPGCSVAGAATWLCDAGDLAPGATAVFATDGIAAAATVTLAAAASSPEDDLGEADEASVSANRPPVAEDGDAATEDRDPVTIPVPATDPDGDPLSATASAAEGTVTVVAGASGPEIVFTPGTTTAGVVTIDFEVCDPDGLCDVGTISVLVKRVFLTAGAVCISDAAYLAYDATAVGVDPDATATVTWTDGVASFSRSGLPLSGLALWPGAEVDDEAKAPADRIATDWPGWLLVGGAWVQGDDGFGWSRLPLDVTVSVNPTSDPVAVTYPAATDDCAADADGPANRPPLGTDLTGWAASSFPYVADLLAGTSDPDGDTVTITAMTPASGKAQVAGGVLTYTPAPTDSGSVVFEVTITDGRGGFDTFTVTIDVASTRTVTGLVYTDADDDGVVDSGEKPIAGAQVTVTHPGPDGAMGTADDLVFATNTAADGTWSIAGVPSGEVTVEVSGAGLAAKRTVTAADFVLTAYEEQLPITGAELAGIGLVGTIIAAAGAALLLATRRRED